MDAPLIVPATFARQALPLTSRPQAAHSPKGTLLDWESARALTCWDVEPTVPGPRPEAGR